MNACDLIHRLHRHRMWVNQNLLEASRSLSREQLNMTLTIGQGSVWKTLTHLMAAEYVWLEALLGNETPLMEGDALNNLPGNQQGDNPIASFTDLETRWQKLDERWDEYLFQLDENDLDEMIYKVSTSSGAGKRYGTRRADVLLHVCTHAQYTTAQCVNMLRQLGQSTFPETMLISLVRSESSA